MLPAYQVNPNPFGESMRFAGQSVGNALMQYGKMRREEQERMGNIEALARTPGIGLAQAESLAANPDVAKNVLAQYMDPMLGMRKNQAEAELGMVPLKRQQMQNELDLNPLKRRALEAEIQAKQRGAADQYGKAGTIVQDRDGTYYSVQFGSNGQKIVAPLEFGGRGLTPSRGVDTVGDTIIDKATGAPVRNVAPNIAGGEQAKIEGREQGERAMGAPKAMASLESADAKSKLVLSKIDQALPMVSAWTAGPGSLLANIPGTPARNLAEIKDTIVANLGFEELQDMRTNSPTGGALGAIAVQELAMLQKTKTSLDQAQTPPQLIKALNELKTFMAGSSERRRRAFEATYSQARPIATQQRPQQAPRPQPNQEAIQFLRSNPALAPKFDEMYGDGAAQRVMGGQ